METPLLSTATVTDPHLHSLSSSCHLPGASEGTPLYLQTSPEYAMKRLLAAGSGAIYQICKAFRDRESGRLHNPEFTLLEWYRPGYDHHDLMDEMDELLHQTVELAPAQRMSYRQAYMLHLGLDPHTASVSELRRQAATHGLGEVRGLMSEDRDGWLDLLTSHLLEPRLARERPTYVYDYPASQAALARIRPGSPPLAERFEVYVQGVELANGFHELADPVEQRQRFAADLARRRAQGLEAVALDERLLAALEAGLPTCSGVALGLDRLLMVSVGAHSLDQVLSFPVARA